MGRRSRAVFGYSGEPCLRPVVTIPYAYPGICAEDWYPVALEVAAGVGAATVLLPPLRHPEGDVGVAERALFDPPGDRPAPVNPTPPDHLRRGGNGRALVRRALRGGPSAPVPGHRG